MTSLAPRIDRRGEQSAYVLTTRLEVPPTEALRQLSETWAGLDLSRAGEERGGHEA
jgi:hypothetical protein